MRSKFPHIHNEGKALIVDGKITLTFFDSWGAPHTVTWRMLSPKAIATWTKARLKRFKSEPPGTRESEMSRKERKLIAAHPPALLRRAWNQMDEPTRMEFVMMLDMASHHGISDPAFARKQTRRLAEVSGDDGKEL